MQGIVQLMRSLVAYGTTAAHAEPERGQALRSWHAISNQIWLWNIDLAIFLAFNFVLFFSLTACDTIKPAWLYPLAYALSPLTAAGLFILFFYLGNRPPKLGTQASAASQFAPPSLYRDI